MQLFEEIDYLHNAYELPVQLYENLEYDSRHLIKMADFYSLSRYLNGQQDDLGRDKGFYNVVNFRTTIAKTATEFDIKDFVATSDDSTQWVQTMLFNREAYKWMKESRFNKFLNKFAYVRPKYGGVLYKKMEKDEDLKIEVCDWRNIYFDQVDILNSPIIERHFMSPLDLYNKKGSWDNVDEAIEMITEKRKSKDEAIDRLEIWEVTGVMSENAYREVKGEPLLEDDEFSLQKYFILREEEEEKEIVFYATKPKELGYRYLAWEEVTGRGLGRGIVEESEEGQVWVNDAMQKQKNTMDIAGRVLIKTNADNIANNILEVDDGKIFKLDDGKDMDAIQLAPSALGNWNNLVEMWNMQLDKATSTFDANTGEQPPSGTPYSQTALLNQVAQRPFAFRQEEAAIELEDMFNEWVLPHLLNKIKGDHFLATDFDEETLAIIDESFANYKKRGAVKDAAFKSLEKALSGELGAQIPEIETEAEAIRAETLENMSKQGARRYIKVPKDFFKGYAGKMTLNITNEQQNKAAILQSLSQILQTVAGSYNPQTGEFSILEDPTLAKIFGTLVDKAGAGLSPAELGIGRPKAKSPQPVTPPTEPVEMPT